MRYLRCKNKTFFSDRHWLLYNHLIDLARLHNQSDGEIVLDKNNLKQKFNISDDFLNNHLVYFIKNDIIQTQLHMNRFDVPRTFYVPKINKKYKITKYSQNQLLTKFKLYYLHSRDEIAKLDILKYYSNLVFENKKAKRFARLAFCFCDLP